MKMLLARRNFKLLRTIHFTCKRNYQVAVTGAGSDIGQTVSMLLRTNPNISRLVLHDNLEHMAGIVLDLSHIPSKSQLKGYIGDSNLGEALNGSSLVIAAGGVPHNSDIVSKSVLSRNAEFIKNIATAVSLVKPIPFFGIVTEPINTLVPLAAEVMRNQGRYDANRLFGITTVDAFRAQTMFARESALLPSECIVPVIGGHSKDTMVPLLSQAIPKGRLTEEKSRALTVMIRDNEIAHVALKQTPVLSIAYGVSLFAQKVLDALRDQTVQMHALIENNDFGTSYFAGLIDVGPKGVCEMRTYTDLYHYECILLEKSIKQLRKDVNVGKKILELV